MARSNAVAADPAPAAGNTVLPGVPIPDWARPTTERWAVPGRGASPIPASWAVLPLPAAVEESEVETATEGAAEVEESEPAEAVTAELPVPLVVPAEHSPLPHLPVPIAANATEPEDERVEVYPAMVDEPDDETPAVTPIPIGRGRHRRS